MSFGRPILDPGVAGGTTWQARVALVGTPARWCRFINTSGTTLTMDRGANGTLVNPDEYNLGSLLSLNSGGSSMGFSGLTPPTHAIIQTVQAPTWTIIAVVQLDLRKASQKHFVAQINDGNVLAGEALCEIMNDGASGLKFRFLSVDNGGVDVVMEGATNNQIPIGEAVMLAWERSTSGLACYTNGVAQPLALISGALSAWSAPAAGNTYIGAFLSGGTPSAGLDGIYSEFLIFTPAIGPSAIGTLAAHPRVNLVLARDLSGGSLSETAAQTTYSIQHQVHPAQGVTVSIQSPPSVGSAAAQQPVLGSTEAAILFTPAAVASDTATTTGYRVAKGVLNDDANFTLTVTDASAATLPEDQPLPAVGSHTTRQATQGDFTSVYASAVAGDHVVLADGSYGNVNLNRSGTASDPIVIRAENLLGATFTSLTISGSRQIVSGINVNLGSTVDAGTALSINASNVRVTRCAIRNGAVSVNWAPAVTDTLIDHCEVHRWRDRGFTLDSPKDQRRITVARCWIHEMLDGGSLTTCHGITWSERNVDREVPMNITVRLNYIGPGFPDPDITTNNDYVHHKGSNSIYAFNRFDLGTSNRENLITHRFGLRTRSVGNYAPLARVNAYDSDGWYYGNSFMSLRTWAGPYAYFDDFKNMLMNAGGFHMTRRARLSGNTGGLVLGFDGGNNNWCTQNILPGLPPDARPAGDIKPQRTHPNDGSSFAGRIYFEDDPDHPDTGIKLRAHSGTITTSTLLTCIPGGQVQNLDRAEGSAQLSHWLPELLTEYPWIQGICPNPCSLTGGPGASGSPPTGGAAPWSVAQALTRGDVAITGSTPNTGPNRPSAGGLP